MSKFLLRGITLAILAQGSVTGRTMVQDRSRSWQACRSSVEQDWRAWLPEEKAEIFSKHRHTLDSLFNMFSVSLNEAIGLRREGCVAQSLTTLGVAADLCRRLVRPLDGLLCALWEHSKHYGTIPSTAPLDPANFAGNQAQRAARLSGLWNRVLLSKRRQFLRKASDVGEMLEDRGQDFQDAASTLREAVPAHPDRLWGELTTSHYDINTCLREAFVLLKSFLVVLPASELGAFLALLQRPARLRTDQAGVFRLGNRRLAAASGILAAFTGK